MRFGLGQFTLQIPPWDDRDHAQLYADTLDLAARADAAGFDSLWLAEHHAAADGYNPSLLPMLAAIAARTERIELGTAVMLAPFHDPLRLAEDAAVVDTISGGRLNLGLGLGWAPEEYRMFGVESKGRGARLGELAQVLRMAWSQDRFSFDGTLLRYDDIAVTPKPKRRIPLWLGGSADQALRRSARYADGYFPPSTQGLGALVERAETVMGIRRELALDGPYSFGAFVPVGIGDDPDDGWAAIRDGVLHVRGSYMLWAQGERDVTDARDGAAPFEEQVRQGCVVGTPQQVVAQIEPVYEKIAALGFDHVFLSAILAPPGTTPARATQAVEAFASDVIPALR